MLLAAILLSSLVQAQAAPSAAPTGQRLRNLAGSFLIGYEAMSNFRSISDTAQFQDVARSEFNFVTSENAMKWDATEPSQNSFNFTQADQLVSFAQANNQKVHGHTLVWHAQTPSWISNGSWNSTTLTNAMYNHIDKVVNHWADGQIYAWDVVNEAFNENGTRRSSVFQNVIGNSFIELAFRRARAADPVTKLIYNDYNVETVNAKSTGMYNMVADFKNRGVPIDGVGLQMHLSGNGIDYNSLAQNMQRFANIGVEVYITEMDVGISSNPSQTELQNQANVYRNVAARCRAQPACKALQVWGVTDKYTWRGGTNPLPFDTNYNAKPAYYALQSVLSGSLTPTPVTPTAIRTPTPVTPVTPTPVTPTPVTPTPGGSTPCSPVTGTVSAPYSYDGAGTFCWQIANIPNYINSWNLTSLKINGVDFTNIYAFATNLPPKINGYWYVSYSGQYAWSHFEAK